MEQIEAEVIEVIQKAFRDEMSATAQKQLEIQREMLKVEQEKLVLYEKRTMVLENMCRALEHFNEQKFHTV